ncbi:hypothetical protein M8494_32265 [Serratia ureilytica]
MWPQLKQSAELLTVFNEIEMPLLPVLSHIERTGVLIDPAILSAHSRSWPSVWLSWRRRPTSWRKSRSTWRRPSSCRLSCTRNKSCRC